jgi:hypothetical protein
LERVRSNPRAASVGIARSAPNKGGRWLVAAVALLGCLLVGCSAGYSSDFSPAPPSPSSVPRPSIPADGITLADLGFLNGPIQQFSVPRTAVIAAKVDQTNNVAVVISSPTPAAVASYLRRTLPSAGFAITADDPTEKTMAFVGNGWSGSFTGDSRASAVLLRPE